MSFFPIIYRFLLKKKNFSTVHCPGCSEKFHIAKRNTNTATTVPLSQKFRLCENALDMTFDSDPNTHNRFLCFKCKTVSEWNIVDRAYPFLERYSKYHLTNIE